MYIQSVEITNYKSIHERQTLNWEPGFNLLVGANNAGKTTVLDVIDLEFGLSEPHRSERTIPEFGGKNNLLSEFEVTLATNFNELWQLTGASQLYLPVTQMALQFAGNGAAESIRNFADANTSLRLISSFGHGLERVTVVGNDLIQGMASRNSNLPVLAALLQYNPSQPALDIQIANTAGVNSIAGQYAQFFKPRIYRFTAQRRPGAQCAAQGSPALDREAITLPYCINHLQTNDAHGHKMLCGWVNRIFPSVKWVQAPPNGGNFELRCLPHIPESRRDDLSIPLARMGAGIGNVIAMLYVVLTSREPQVIAIDEPNAFLHPRALRELLAILEAEGKQHQFILTAHSADVLTAVNTKTISFLDFDGIATTVRQVGHKDLHLLRSNLAELGIRMTDLHAKDRVLWVEGQTEELVMPDLLRWACPEIAAGTSVLRVERTGTFSKKGVEPDEVAQLYERLSTSSALVPPMVCILLDGETHSEEHRRKTEAGSKGKLRFLDRRMLENYLLHPQAIVATLAVLDLSTNIEDVGSSLTRNIGSADAAEVDGAKVLKAVFSELSEAKLEFRKTRDVPTLVEWLLENDPEYLAPLRSFLRSIFEIGDKGPSSIF
ncbi:ATP-dependent endonuclease [Rhodoferax sp. BLA1]|uniref:ATP-dependent nuclease n=1 Tax=Rhodoferax sp. BLA1 TaxID=2576062 RepID=UPI0015D2C6BB|nr:AAA family ATPase [Rhodoferax sp. BLA1]